MNNLYIDSIMLFERLHRLFFTVIKKDLANHSISDLTPVQALVIYNIKDKTMKIADITTNKFYLGSNVSYNLRQMLANDYILMSAIERDKRVSRISLSEKGKEFYKRMDEIICTQVEYHSNFGLANKDMELLLGYCHNLEIALQRYFLGS